MIIIMTMPCYKIGKSLMTVAYYESNNNDKFDNNKDKVCLLLRR